MSWSGIGDVRVESFALNIGWLAHDNAPVAMIAGVNTSA